jgi:hypothetical protein
MTLYEAWSRGHKWVVVRGYLCKISPKRTRFWVAHLGRWKYGQFCSMMNMSEPCRPVEPNSREFRKLYRG